MPTTKTRLAPTPSGFLHLGNILSFVITVSLARRSGAKILLRIDDLDQARVNKDYIQDIFDTLNFLEIPWDEGPRNAKDFKENYSQLQRMDLYHAALTQLADEGKVFACTCSRKQTDCTCMDKQIPLTTKNASWRLMTGMHPELSVRGYNGEISKATLPVEMNSFVVKKKDGFPAYQLTSVIDDLFYGVDLIVRGDDLWPSTLAQHELALALGKDDFRNITFYHHPLLMETPEKKLSKSAGATSVKHLRESGKRAAEVFQLIADMLGGKLTATDWKQLGDILVLNSL